MRGKKKKCSGVDVRVHLWLAVIGTLGEYQVLKLELESGLLSSVCRLV